MFKRQKPDAGIVDGKLPVFVFPSSLSFHSDDSASHKQIMTLYNPYEFAIKFKVLCTAPHKYSVVDSEGNIKARCCVDIVIRHKEIGINNEGIRDKFRIHINEHGQKTILGKKDVVSMLLPTSDKASQVVEETFESLTVQPGLKRSDSQTSLATRSIHGCAPGASTNPTGPSWLIISSAILCIVALMLPTQGETDSRLPTYLFLSVNQKLIAGYILGLVTMAILRS